LGDRVMEMTVFGLALSLTIVGNLLYFRFLDNHD
jgi:hypothetical protein